MTTKTFDAVRLMRELRDRLSREMGQMTPEERMCYIREKAASTGLGTESGEGQGDAGQQADAADRPSADR